MSDIAASNFKVINYRYEEPEILPDSKNSEWNGDYRYQYFPPYNNFVVSISVFLIVKENEKSICHSEIDTETVFNYSKEQWEEKGLLNNSGDLNKDSESILTLVTDLVERAFWLTQDAVTVRQVNTKCEGIDMYKVDRFNLEEDIKRRLQRTLDSFSSPTAKIS
jgi:hypothetical protein